MARDPFFAHRATAHVLDALLATRGNLAERPLRAHGKGHGPGPHFAAMRLQRLNLFPSLAPEVQGAAHGYKGKGVTTHLIIDAHGHPLGALFTAAHIDELKERLQLLKALGIWKREGMILETDRSCTSKSLQEPARATFSPRHLSRDFPKRRASDRTSSRSLNQVEDRKSIFQPQAIWISVREKATGLAIDHFLCIDRLQVGDFSQIDSRKQYSLSKSTERIPMTKELFFIAMILNLQEKYQKILIDRARFWNISVNIYFINMS